MGDVRAGKAGSRRLRIVNGRGVGLPVPQKTSPERDPGEITGIATGRNSKRDGGSPLWPVVEEVVLRH